MLCLDRVLGPRPPEKVHTIFPLYLVNSKEKINKNHRDFAHHNKV